MFSLPRFMVFHEKANQPRISDINFDDIDAVLGEFKHDLIWMWIWLTVILQFGMRLHVLFSIEHLHLFLSYFDHWASSG